MRYPSRLLTDDHRRAFTRRAARHGGIVVIDQSGSMDVDPRDCTRLCVKPHARSSLATATVLAIGERRRTAGCSVTAVTVASSYPSGNVGNGVDGAVLSWALGQRRGREPVVWVTDGQVTDSHDHPDDGLAALVRAPGSAPPDSPGSRSHRGDEGVRARTGRSHARGTLNLAELAANSLEIQASRPAVTVENLLLQRTPVRLKIANRCS